MPLTTRSPFDVREPLRKNPRSRAAEAPPANVRRESRRLPPAVYVVALALLSLVFVSSACASVSASQPATAPSANVRTLTVEVGTPASPVGAGVSLIACDDTTLAGSFCDALQKLRRAVNSDGDVRRCIQSGELEATSPLAEIDPRSGMWCHAHRTGDATLAPNPPGQSDVVVDCRFRIRGGYAELDVDTTRCFRGVADAIATCDGGYWTAPSTSVRNNDSAIQYSHSERGSPLQDVVTVSTEPVASTSTDDQAAPPCDSITMRVYRVTPEAVSPRRR